MSLQPALIEYASPTLASLKCGSLFSLIPADMQLLKREAAQMSAILAPKGLSLRLSFVASRGWRGVKDGWECSLTWECWLFLSGVLRPAWRMR